ncbi:MAG: CDP-glycerol glycerophosphotransferase family protein [Coriobacteriia bacterium]|nr:CDP-glycerol glycerophosphotransferase family protein [Coriobacteriia bacterium]
MNETKALYESVSRFPTITDVTIEGLYLGLTISDAGNHDIYLTMGKKGKLMLPKKEIEQDVYHIELNLCCVGKNSFLSNGTYLFGFYDSELAESIGKKSDAFMSCAVHESVSRRISSLSRVYKYGKNNYAYNISFDIFGFADVMMHLKMASYFLRVDKKWERRKTLAFTEQKTLAKKTKSLLTALYYAFLGLAYRTFSLVHKQSTALILYKFTGSLAGNLAALYQRILERGVDKQCSVVLQCSDGVGEKMKLFGYIKLVNNLAKARYVFVDGSVPLLKHIKLVPNTKLVQLWHGGAGFKRAGLARFGNAQSVFPNHLSHRQVAHALAASPPLTRVFSEVIGIPEDRFFTANMPRLNTLVDSENVERVKTEFFSKYPQFQEKRIILFAPTFRGGLSQAYYPYSMMDFEKMHEILGNDSVLVVKMHQGIKELPLLDKYASNMIDLSKQAEINDLLVVSDVLITDYSSTYYDYALLKRPMLFYCFDKYVYENTRGVYQTVDDGAPGKVVNTFDELLLALQTEDYDYDKTLAFYDEFFGDFYSQQSASDYVIDNFLLASVDAGTTD